MYLLIGLYVLFRRWTAPKSTHFYVFCLVSFVLYAFRSTGEPGLFDQMIYWGNLIANMLQPALFLHFAVSFSDAAGSRGRCRHTAGGLRTAAAGCSAAVCAGSVPDRAAGVGDAVLVGDRAA